MTSPRTAREDLDRGLVLLRRSLAYWKRALIVIIVGTLLAVPYVFTRPRAYRSETVILYQETLRSSDITGGESGDNARRVGARLREVLLSRQTLEPIINDHQLYMKNGASRRALTEAVDEMRKHINFRAREGDTFEIAFEGSTPEEAQEITRRLGECIISDASSRRNEQAKALKEFLTAESERNNVDLRNKEAELAKFVALHPALAARLMQPNTGAAAAPPPVSGPGTYTRPPPGDPILGGLEARAARIERQLAKAKDPTPPPPPKPLPTFVPPPDSPELIAARKDLADKLSRYTDKHPDVSAARARLRAAEEAQAGVHQQALDAHTAAVASARAAAQDEPPPKTAADEAELQKQLIQIQAQIAQRRAFLQGDAGASAALTIGEPAGSTVALEVEFRRLERDVAEGRERQKQLDDKLFRASITAGAAASDRNIQVSVLDPAYLPTRPVSKSRVNLLAGLLAVIFAIAIGLAVGSAKLDDRIHDRGDLERLDILPIVGVIPRELPPSKPQQ
jgi:uncharacterized protein involved in exopolysaccharide biosynthesis